METFPKKRIEIIIEAPMQQRVTKILAAHGVSGWTVFPAIAGGGRNENRWTADGSVSRAGAAVMILCITSAERLDPMLEEIFQVVDRYIGLVAISDCTVMRPDRF